MSPGNSPPKTKNSAPGADDRDGADQAVHEAQAGARQQVVGQGVPGEAGDQGHGQQPDTDQPVHLTRLAEGACEEDAQHVHEGRGDEQQGRPVVDLPDEEAAAHVEGDVQRRGERLGHGDALHELVGAGVLNLAHRRLEPDGQEDTGQQQHDEGVQGDLAEQEGPVVREHLAQGATAELGQWQAVVGPRHGAGTGHRLAGRGLLDLKGRGGLADDCRLCHHASPFLKSTVESRSKKLGPTGTVKSLCATR